MKIDDLQNVIWKEGGHYVAQSLSVDVASFGETKDEARKNLREALELYFEDNSVTPPLVQEVEITTV